MTIFLKKFWALLYDFFTLTKKSISHNVKTMKISIAVCIWVFYRTFSYFLLLCLLLSESFSRAGWGKKACKLPQKWQLGNLGGKNCWLIKNCLFWPGKNPQFLKKNNLLAFLVAAFSWKFKLQSEKNSRICMQPARLWLDWQSWENSGLTKHLTDRYYWR